MAKKIVRAKPVIIMTGPAKRPLLKNKVVPNAMAVAPAIKAGPFQVCSKALFRTISVILLDICYVFRKHYKETIH